MAPDLLDDETRKTYNNLDLPGFSIPSSNDLNKRETLDCFFSRELNVPLGNHPMEGQNDSYALIKFSFY